jgi:atypical dual specificity phosphatase
MLQYYWLYPDLLAGGVRPGGANERFPDRERLTQDLRSLARQNLRAILTLTEAPLPEEALARAGTTALHLPVPDMTAPTPAQLLTALDFIDQSQASGAAVYVHCLMGQGRTGTVLAAYLVRAGFSPAAAIERIRALRPGSLVAEVQERAITDFARERYWIL